MPREFITIESKQRINGQIRAREVRLIGAEGQQLGVLPSAEALALARQAGLDLVEVSPNEQPPVTRIMDFGKFTYQKNKRRKNPTHQARLKEIRVRPQTGAHDIEMRVAQARKFLEHRDKVLITLIFRGRELAHIDEGQKIVDRIVGQLADVATVEKPSSRQAKRLTCVLSPR